MALETPIENAESYIRHAKHVSDVSEIAWRFLLGNRILEYLRKMEIDPRKGSDFKIIANNQNSYTVQLGNENVILHLEAIEPNGGNENPEIQPNLK
jgi:hypothetical protein